jgi:hypothetical protein
MSLRPLKTVHRRGDWRVRLPFWDRETFEFYTVAQTGKAGDAVVSFALFHRGHDCDHARWLRDYGWGRCGYGFHPQNRRRRPALNVFSDDGTGYLRVAEDRVSGLLSVPQPIVAALPGGVYLASLAAAYGDGSVIDLGSEFVTIEGPETPTVWHGPLMAGGAQGAGSRTAVNDIFPFSVPILPGAAGAWVTSAVARNRTDPTADAPNVIVPPPYIYEGPMTAGGYQPAGTDAPVNSLVTDQTQTGPSGGV